MSRIAVDTNILVYAEGVEHSPADRKKIDFSRRLMRGLLRAQERPVIAVQALAEFYRVLLRKGGLPRRDVAERVRRTRTASELIATTPEVLDAALDLASEHGVQIFDAVILAAAAHGGCDLLLSEDFQDGFAWRGVVVTNPFGPAPDRRLARVMARGG